MTRYNNRKPTGQSAVESRKEREDKAFTLFADMLIKKLESCQATQWHRPWFAEGTTAWPKALYGKPYNGMNALMLTLLCEKEGYKIPVFATSDRIFSLNFTKNADGTRVPAVNEQGEKLPFVHILKGEHSFPVILSCVNIVHNETRERIKWADYVRLTPEEQKDYKVYHNRIPYNVFNVDQTNIKEARPELYEKLLKENVPEKVDVKEGEAFTFDPIDVMIEKNLWICPIKVKELKAGDSPHYSLKYNEVVLGEKIQYAKGGHPESWVNDAFHEMIHSTGYKECLDRFKEGRDKDSYAREELVAEVGAALSCHRYGIPKTIKEDSIPYVQSWLRNLHEKPEFIRTVLKDVKMATSILDSKVEYVRKEFLGEEEKLDLREEDEAALEFDEDGDAHLSQTESVDPDKKQGEAEGKGESYEEERKHGMRM